MSKSEEIMKIAAIHATRIKSATKYLEHLFPLDADKLNSLSENDLAWIDLLVNRFGKLQDLIGAKLINTLLESQIEDTQTLTMLDKIHKLERLNIIDDVQLWKNMREVRNHIAHEYPDNPEVMVVYLNQILELTPKLLKILNNIEINLNNIK